MTQQPAAPNDNPKGLLNYPRQGVIGWRRWLPSLRLMGFAVLAGILGIIGLFSIGYAVVSIPPPNAEAAGQTSTVYWADGKTPLGTFKVEDRVSVPISEISKPMQHAAIAAEDQSFYENRGISIKGISRAVWGVATNNYAGGGSTITQQYVKNYYLTNEHTSDRKVREMFIALKIDQELSKDTILANYLNTIYLGRQSYGVQVAARNYFGVSADELNVAQAALLAAMIQSPSAADPAKNPEAFQSRFQYVLDNMASLGYITEEQAKTITIPEVKEREVDNEYRGNQGYLLKSVRQELKAKGFTDEKIDRGGLKIISTFNQRDTEAAVEAIEDLPEMKDGMHAGLVSILPETGGVNAMYGGEDYLKRQRNSATQDMTQAGSTFKPFALVAALENGYRLNDILPGTSGITFSNGGTPWSVDNYNHKSYGSVSLLKATQNSINTAYAKLNIAVGPEKTVDVAKRAGLPASTDGLEANAANVLGTASPTVLNMASAYATFAANGVYHTPHVVTKVLSGEGKELYQVKVEGKRVFNKNVMAEATYALRQVVQGGSGSYAQNLGRPAAGKTGTSENSYSAWFVGYTPNMAAAVSIFREDEHGNPTKIGVYGGRSGITGGSFPTMAWTDYMRTALKDVKVEQFPKRGKLPDVKKPVPKDASIGVGVGGAGTSAANGANATSRGGGSGSGYGGSGNGYGSRGTGNGSGSGGNRSQGTDGSAGNNNAGDNSGENGTSAGRNGNNGSHGSGSQDPGRNSSGGSGGGSASGGSGKGSEGSNRGGSGGSRSGSSQSGQTNSTGKKNNAERSTRKGTNSGGKKPSNSRSGSDERSHLGLGQRHAQG